MQFDELRANCAPGTLGDWLALADWARAVTLYEEADELYRLVLEEEPLNERAFQGLLALAEHRPPVRITSAYEAARALLPARFVLHETRRFMVLSDADAQWTRSQVQRLERTHHQFQRFVARLGLRALPQRHKFVCALFADREEYQQFARTNDDVADPWIAGYYSPASSRIVFYQGQANPSVVEAFARLEEMQAEIDSMGEEHRRAVVQGNLEQADSLRRHQKLSQEHVDRERNRVSAFAEQVNVATTIHEATHQLLFHTRVQSPYVQYPIWISEGLATAFETDSPDEPFGPDCDFAPRREAFQELLRDDDLIVLSRLVSWSAVPSNHHRVVHAVYHQSYALVTWMTRSRKDELRRFLELMLLEPTGEPDGARYLELFEEAFGDVSELEQAWLRHERSQLGD